MIRILRLDGHRQRHTARSRFGAGRVACFLFAAFWGLCWVASPVPAQGLDTPTVVAVRVEGLERIGEQLVRSQIETQVGEPLSQRAVARDIRRLYDLGHFTNIAVDAQTSADGVALTYIFEEKRVIDEVVIAGNRKLSLRQVRTALTWRAGQPFLVEDYDRERQAIIELYASKGYPNAQVAILVEKAGPSRVKVTCTIDEGRKARIKSISFEGNDALSNRQIRKKMKTKRSWWFFGGLYDEHRFEVDLNKIIEMYGDHGYLEAEVPGADFDFDSDGKAMHITIFVDEGAQYHVESLSVANNVVFDNDEMLRPYIVKVREGEVHNKSQVNRDAELIEKGYRDSGYVDARVSPKVTLDKESKTTHIVHDVYEGDLKYVREITVTGNTITRDGIIRQRLLVAPGDRFDGSAVRASERALENADYFDEIRLSLEDDPEYDRYTNLSVDVEEGKTGTFQFGGGYGTDEGLGGYVELRKNNFDITNWPTLDGGGQHLKLKLSIGEKTTQYNLSFNDPQIFGYPIGMGLDLFDERRDYTGGIDFTEENSGVQLSFAKSLSHYVTANASFRYEKNDVADWTFISSPALRPYQADDTTVSSTWSITRNTLDNFRDPARGSKHTVAFQVAGLGGDNEFLRLDHDSSWYHAFDEGQRWILSYRWRGGILEPYGDTRNVPLSFRYYAGGSGTVRGYESRDIGPEVRRFWIFGEKYRVGGELRLVNNLELKYKLTEELRLYTFVDAGTVWRKSSDFDLGDVQYGAGLGIGFDVPRMGPIRVDYGFPLNPEDDQGSGRMHLSTGFRF